MKTPLTRSETGLVVALIQAIALAFLGSTVAQYANYHAFADPRTLWGLPMAMDVLSNLPFALLGAWGVPLELGDHHILALTDGLVSGHTLKHLAAAMAAWPVLAVMQNGAYRAGPAPGRPQLPKANLAART